MEEPLIFITSGITILALAFLYLYFKVYQDNLELKRKYAELEKTECKDQENYKAREDFIAMLVHELRAPLSVIKGSADLLLKEVSKLTQDQVFELLREIRLSSSDLLNLVNDMLDVSKIESGRFEIYVKDVRLNDVLEESVHRFNMLSEQKHINLNVHFDPHITNLKMDAEKIRQVMSNLLSNALKFTPENGTVNIVSEKIDGKARVTVSDSGMGIPEDIKNKLFNKFVQGRSVDGMGKGTGLGLVIAKGIIEAHGGIIWMEDNKPKGSKFVFTLPLS